MLGLVDVKDYTISQKNESSSHGEKTLNGKADISTFIEELEETTEKLMNQVFNLPSISDIKYRPQAEETHTKKEAVYKPKIRQQITVTKAQFKPKAEVAAKTKQKRDEYWKKSVILETERQKRLQDLCRSQDLSVEKSYTYRPKINPSTIQQRPLYERSMQIVKSKEEKLKNQRILQKAKKESEDMSHAFAPKLNASKQKTRTIEEFYHDKVIWQKRKQEAVEQQKQLDEVKKHKECTFEPEIMTTRSPFFQQNKRKNKGTKVEDRLHGSLEKTAVKLHRMRTVIF